MKKENVDWGDNVCFLNFSVFSTLHCCNHFVKCPVYFFHCILLARNSPCDLFFNSRGLFCGKQATYEEGRYFHTCEENKKFKKAFYYIHVTMVICNTLCSIDPHQDCFLREILLFDNETGWKNFGNFYETDFSIFEVEAGGRDLENWKICE